MNTAALRSIEELLVSEIRHQTKQNADLIVTLKLQLQEKNGIIFMLRGSCLAAIRSTTATEIEKQCRVSIGRIGVRYRFPFSSRK